MEDPDLTREAVLAQLDLIVSRDSCGRHFTVEEAGQVLTKVIDPLLAVINDPAPYPNLTGVDLFDYIAALQNARVKCDAIYPAPIRMPEGLPWIIEKEEWHELILEKLQGWLRYKKLDQIAAITKHTVGWHNVSDDDVLLSIWGALEDRMSTLKGLDYVGGGFGDQYLPGWLMNRMIEYVCEVVSPGRRDYRAKRLDRFERLWPFLLKAPPIGFHHKRRRLLIVLC